MSVHGTDRTAAGGTARLRVRAVTSAALVVAAWTVLVAVAPPASATNGHAFGFSFGAPGSGDGQLALQHYERSESTGAETAGSGVAVDAQSGDVFVADTGNHRVVEFSSTGSFVRAFGWGVADGKPEAEVCTTGCRAGISGSEPGELETPSFIAVDNACALHEPVLTGTECEALDPSAGDVYVGDTGDDLISKFTAAGQLVSGWARSGQLGEAATFATGTGNIPTGLAAGTGTVKAGSTTITNVSTSNGTFEVGQGIEAENPDGRGQVFEQGTYITAMGAGTLTVSAPPQHNGAFTLETNRRFVTGLSTTSGAFLEEQAIQGVGIPAGTHIRGAGAHVLWLGQEATAGGDGVALSAEKTGGLASPEGIAVDRAGHLWDYEWHGFESMLMFDSAGGSFAGGFSMYRDGAVPAVVQGPALGVAFDAAGDLFLGGPFGSVAETGPTGELLGFLIRASTGDSGRPPVTALTTDPSTRDFYYDEGGAVGHIVSPCTLSPDPSHGGCTPVESFGAEQLSAGGEGAGLTVDPVSHGVLVADAGADRVDVYPVALEGETGSAGEVRAVTATLRGEVNPKGTEVAKCLFEYGTGEEYGHTVPCAESASQIGSGVAPMHVHADVEDLQNDTAYHFRLVVGNSQVPRLAGEDKTFTTEPLPAVEKVTTNDVTASSARLQACVQPRGVAAEYHFEWGASTAYGNVTPAPDQAVGSGDSCVPVSVPISGLSANVTYHWRVVASNAFGSYYTPDQTFVYDTSGGGLPDGRAYEMVTPSAKNGALIGSVFLGTPPQVGEAGSTVVALSIQCFAGAQSCVGNRQNQGEPYAFTRTSSGWVTTPLAPPVSEFSTNTSWLTGAEPVTGLFSMPTAPAGEDDWYARQPDGSFVHIGPVTSPTLGALGVEGVIGTGRLVTTANLSHIVYETETVWPFDESKGVTTYEYVGSNATSPTLVGVSGGFGSTDLISTCGTEVGGSANSTHSAYGSLSRDGRIVYFVALKCGTGSGVNEGMKVPANELWARIDQSRSVLVSARSTSECESSACKTSPVGDAEFEGASTDGSRLFFTDTQQLTDRASQDPDKGDSVVTGCSQSSGAGGCNLYEYENTASEDSAEQHLVDVSAGDSSGEGPRVQGVMAISSDGTHVYFVAKGVLATMPNDLGETAQNGANNLYVYERYAAHPQGQLAFIATLPSSDEAQWRNGVEYANVTPDGRFLVFESHAALTVDDARPEGPVQVYRYDAQTGNMLRISIGQDGFNDNGNAGVADASILPAVRAITGRDPARSDPTMSHDGSYVFFMSPVGLTPQALNDIEIGTSQSRPAYAQNVYEWHEGQVSLISDGHDTSQQGGLSAVQLLGADATGANVFFGTADPLVPADTDTQRDYYDARICTPTDPCIKQAPPPSPPCLGEACHGTPAATPPLLAAPTVTFDGQGNLVPPSLAAKVQPKKKPAKCAKGKTRKHGKCVKRRAKTGKKARWTKSVARVKANRRGK